MKNKIEEEKRIYLIKLINDFNNLYINPDLKDYYNFLNSYKETVWIEEETKKLKNNFSHLMENNDLDNLEIITKRGKKAIDFLIDCNENNFPQKDYIKLVNLKCLCYLIKSIPKQIEAGLIENHNLIKSSLKINNFHNNDYLLKNSDFIDEKFLFFIPLKNKIIKDKLLTRIKNINDNNLKEDLCLKIFFELYNSNRKKEIDHFIISTLINSNKYKDIIYPYIDKDLILLIKNNVNIFIVNDYTLLINHKISPLIIPIVIEKIDNKIYSDKYNQLSEKNKELLSYLNKTKKRFYSEDCKTKLSYVDNNNGLILNLVYPISNIYYEYLNDILKNSNINKYDLNTDTEYKKFYSYIEDLVNIIYEKKLINQEIFEVNNNIDNIK